MDNLGAIGGPLLALALVALVGVRSAILLSVIPGLLAAVAIVIAIRSAPTLGVRERRPRRIQVRPVLHGGLGRLFRGIGAFDAPRAFEPDWKTYRTMPLLAGEAAKEGWGS